MYKIKATIVSVLTIALLCITTLQVSAQEEATVKMKGLYAHPYTGIIEDSGGESSQALGQSMVDKIVSEYGLLESGNNGQLYVAFSFSLMNSISQVTFTTQDQGNTTWTGVDPQIVATGDDNTTFRIPIESEGTVVKANCFVAPMGRSVIFYIVFDSKVAGNQTSIIPLNEPTIEVAEEIVNDSVNETAAPSSNETLEEIFSDENESEEVEMISADILDNVTGLTIGGQQSERSADEVEAANDSDSGEELILGNGFWMHAFMLLVSVNTMTAILVLVLYFSLKNIFRKEDKVILPQKKIEMVEEEDHWDDIPWEDIEGIIDEKDSNEE